MSKPGNDISQIKKYLEGRLDSHAMHELERRALDDPFLADALEGYENSANQQKENLAELSDRLQSRTHQKVRGIIPWARLSMAASILVLIGLGTWVVLRNKPEKNNTVANLVRTDTQSSPKISAPPTIAQPSNADTGNLIAGNAQPKLSAPSPASPHIRPGKSKPAESKTSEYDNTAPPPAASNKNAETVQAEKPVPMNSNADKVAYNSIPRDSTAVNEIAVEQMASKKKAEEVTITKTPQASPETQLQSHVDGLDVQPAHKDLTGYVIAANGGQPLVGAIVKLSGAPFGVATDANGKFVMHNVPDKKNLVVGYLGYNTKKVKVNNSDSVNVTLEPSGSALSEVVVAKKNQDVNSAASIADAHPSAGWKALNDYLDKNAVASDGAAGRVKLSFTVNGKGALGDFKITKSLSDAADKKAIDLIANGPAWAGNIDGQPHKVKLTVKFH